MCLLLSYTTIPFIHPFPTDLERPELQRWKENFLPSLPPSSLYHQGDVLEVRVCENHGCALYNQDCSAINSTAEHKGALG